MTVVAKFTFEELCEQQWIFGVGEVSWEQYCTRTI